MFTINLYSMHMSKELWGDPENFRPERFLDAEGKFKKSEYLQPFGMGKLVKFCINSFVGDLQD